MAKATTSDLIIESIRYLLNTVYGTAVTFGILAILTLWTTSQIQIPEARGVAVLALLGASINTTQRNIFSESKGDAYGELHPGLKFAVALLAIGYYNLVVFAAIFLYFMVSAMFGGVIAAMVAVLYPIYDYETSYYPYPISIGGAIHLITVVTGMTVEALSSLRDIDLPEIPFYLYERTRHRRIG